jgi:hypothetical protein
MPLIDKNAAISLDPKLAETVATKATIPAVSPKTLYDAPVAAPAKVEMAPEATFNEGVIAGAKQTLAKALWDTMETPEFEVQPGYSPEVTYRHDVQKFGSQFNPDEQEYLLGAKSSEEYTHRLQVTVDKQQDMAVMAEAPVGAIAGSIVDVDLFLGFGVGKAVGAASKAAQLSKAVAMAGSGVVGGTAAGMLSTSTQEATNREDAMVVGDILASGVGSLFAGAANAPKFAPRKLPAGPDAVMAVDDAAGGSMRPLFSTYDRLASYIGKDKANTLLANPMDDIGDSAVTHARNAKLDGDRRLASYEAVVQGIVGRGITLNPRARAAIREQRLGLEYDMLKLLNTNRAREIDGLPPITHPNANVQKMADAYINSGYAVEMLKKMKAAGVDGADDIAESANYIPVRHSYDKMRRMVQQGKVSMDSIYQMYGSQIAKMYPGLTDLGLTPSKIGSHFVETQKGAAPVGGIRGVLKEELRHMLVNAGVGKDKIDNLLNDLYKKTEDAGKAANLRRRMDWDFGKVHVDNKGNTISINDFIESDVTSVMQRYNRSMAGRIGLAQAGYPTEASLREALQSGREAFKGDHNLYDKFVEDVQNGLLGRPTGEQLPDFLRTGNTVGAMMQLANSGLYNLVDYGTIAKNFGVTAVAKHFVKSLRGSGIGAVTVKDAETVQQVISGRLIAEGRMRDVVTHLEDNFEAPAGGLHEAVSYAGQSTRFLNGSEFVRRHQVNMVAGILDDLTTKLAAGDAKATEFFARQNIPADRIAAIKAQVDKHGTQLEDWDDYATKEYYTTQMISATDNIAVMVRNGEIPTMMAHSAVGKMLFPYLNFTFAMTQKLLRREYTRNGAVGVAGLLLAQAPLAVLSAAMINISGGKPWDEDLATKTVKALPTLGVGGVAYDFALRGEIGGVSPTFGAINQVAKTGGAIVSGNASSADLLKTVPGAAVFVPARMLTTLIDSEGKD